MKRNVTIITCKLAAIAAGLVNIKILTNHLGAQSYGVWAVYLTLVSLLSLFDIGLNNSNLNRRISKARYSRNTVVHNASTISGIAATIISLPIIYWVINENIQPVILVAVAITALTFYISNFYKSILNGDGNGYEISKIEAIFSVAMVLAIILTAKIGKLNLNALIVLNSIMTLGMAVTLRQKIIRSARINWMLKLLTFKSTFKTYKVMYSRYNGQSFFLMQIAAVLATQIDTVIIFLMLGPESAAVWAVATRLISPINTIAATVLTSERHKFAKLLGGNGFERLSKAYIQLRYEMGLLILAAITIAAFGEEAIKAWTNNTIHTPQYLMALLAIWMIVDITGRITSEYLLANNEVRSQLKVALAYVGATAIMKLSFIPLFGVIAMPISNLVAYITLVVPIYLKIIQR